MKALMGVKYGKMSTRSRIPPHAKSQKKMSGRSGPPMVDIGAKSERVGTAQTVRMAGKPHRFAHTGSVSERTGNTGPDHRPSVGRMSGHGTWASMGIRKSK